MVIHVGMKSSKHCKNVFVNFFSAMVAAFKAHIKLPRIISLFKYLPFICSFNQSSIKKSNSTQIIRCSARYTEGKYIFSTHAKVTMVTTVTWKRLAFASPKRPYSQCSLDIRPRFIFAKFAFVVSGRI